MKFQQILTVASFGLHTITAIVIPTSIPLAITVSAEQQFTTKVTSSYSSTEPTNVLDTVTEEYKNYVEERTRYPAQEHFEKEDSLFNRWLEPRAKKYSYSELEKIRKDYYDNKLGSGATRASPFPLPLFLDLLAPPRRKSTPAVAEINNRTTTVLEKRHYSNRNSGYHFLSPSSSLVFPTITPVAHHVKAVHAIEAITTTTPTTTHIQEPTFYYDNQGIRHTYSQQFRTHKSLASPVPKGIIGLGSLGGRVGDVRSYEFGTLTF
ncbi:hypothetical protein WICPIJ_002593 [Wickerhamomyces pijperi]|uniref:Uncharacterized protein n=1 Tax=Wickerhamomyces pijperi TaxID=599730 RepID=A0A9P8QBH5_WICPI|nr:hypothetical protein WICPIJ_002593 [Wickerhamomyces pijperi]